MITKLMNNSQITQYVKIMLHVCSNSPNIIKAHMIKDCKDKKIYIDTFIKMYKEGKWIPQDE